MPQRLPEPWVQITLFVAGQQSAENKASLRLHCAPHPQHMDIHAAVEMTELSASAQMELQRKKNYPPTHIPADDI